MTDAVATVRRGLFEGEHKNTHVGLKRRGRVWVSLPSPPLCVLTHTFILTLPTRTIRSTAYALSYISCSYEIPSALDGVCRRSSSSNSQSLGLAAMGERWVLVEADEVMSAFTPCYRVIGSGCCLSLSRGVYEASTQKRAATDLSSLRGEL